MRTNYVTNPSIETATTGWYRTDTCVGTAAITRVSGGQVGDYALQFAYTAEASDATGTATQYCSPTAVGTAAQGDKWTVSAYVKKGAGTTSGVTVTLRIAYYNEAGAYIGQVSGADIFSSLTTSFQRFSYTGTLPADGAISRVAVALVVSGIADGDAFDLVSDAWLLEKVDALDDYFDGSTTDTDDWDYEWAWTAHASLSTATPALYAPELVAYQSDLNIVVEWTQGPEYIDVSAAPYSIDKTGATSVTAALDGSDGVLATIRDAGGIAYFPAGTYLLSTALTVPDGCKLAGPLGAGPDSTAHLKGTVRFGSTSAFTDLKIGDTTSSTYNQSGATTTTFTRCHFRGGGGSSLPTYNVVSLGGTGGSCDHITFTDCEFERNYITDTVRDTRLVDKNNCVIAIMARTSTVDTVIVDGCHIGVSNGMTEDCARNTGSPFAGLLCWTANTSGTATWKNISLIDTTIEVCDWDGIDLADYCAGTISGPITIDNCTIAGADSEGICVEGPHGVEVKNCTIGRCYGYQYVASSRGSEPNCYDNIHDNEFDMRPDNGVTARYADMPASIQLSDGEHIFADNNWYGYGIRRQLRLNVVNNATVTGNYFRDYLTEEFNRYYYASTVEAGCVNLTYTGNTFWRDQATDPRSYDGGGHTNTTISNTFTHS